MLILTRTVPKVTFGKLSTKQAGRKEKCVMLKI
jgi:hypothetical protein